MTVVAIKTFIIMLSLFTICLSCAKFYTWHMTDEKITIINYVVKNDNIIIFSILSIIGGIFQ